MALCQGLGGWGAATPWQAEQVMVTPPALLTTVAKSFPWQSWQEDRPSPPLLAARLALAPWLAEAAHPGTGSW